MHTHSAMQSILQAGARCPLLPSTCYISVQQCHQGLQHSYDKAEYKSEQSQRPWRQHFQEQDMAAGIAPHYRLGSLDIGTDFATVLSVEDKVFTRNKLFFWFGRWRYTFLFAVRHLFFVSFYKAPKCFALWCYGVIKINR